MSPEIKTTEVPNPPLEVPRDKRGRIRWAVLKQDPAALETFIFQSASDFVAAGGRFTQRELRRKGNFVLNRAISLSVLTFAQIRRQLSIQLESPSDHANRAGRIKDAEGESWVHSFAIKKDSGLSYPTIKRLLSDTDSITGKTKGGKQAKFYREVTAQERVQQFLDLPVVDTKTQEYTDKEGNIWVTLNQVANTNGVDVYALKGLANQTPIIPGRASSGRRVELYNKKELLKIVSDRFIDPPKTDKHGIYRDPKGKRWLNGNAAGKKYGIGYDRLYNHLASTATLIARDITNKLTTVYFEEELDRIFSKEMEQPLSPHEANEQLKRLLED